MHNKSFWLKASVSALALAAVSAPALAAPKASGLDQIQTVVVIYAENRSFDNLFNGFPGADTLKPSDVAKYRQVDRDGSLLKELPPSWGGVTAKGVVPAISQEASAHMKNEPFVINDPKGLNAPLNVTTRDLWHRFYQNQMQLDGGKSDKYAAWGDAGGLTMGHYNGASQEIWKIAHKYTLADNFYQSAFGGSFLNHIYLICSCAPVYPNADKSPAKGIIAAVEADGITLTPAPDAPKSALQGPPKFVNDGALTPDFYAVNTMQPPYQPSNNKPAADGDKAYADPNIKDTLPPQTALTIGDLLTSQRISWAWYGGAFQAALDGKGAAPVPNFQTHHQPFNYFAAYAPGTPARKEHLRDGGLGGNDFMLDIDTGSLPAVSFYKPQGNLNEHPGYTDVQSGDAHIVDVIHHLEQSPQWKHMLVVVTYDEFGGFWDHKSPPKGDRFGPGTRIPALIISPYAKKGTVDHTFYDTTSIIRFLDTRYGLPKLPGIVVRDKALEANHSPKLGDLTAALTVK